MATEINECPWYHDEAMGIVLSRRIQHILNENPIPRSRVIHQNMGHSTDKLPILYNRAAGHG